MSWISSTDIKSLSSNFFSNISISSHIDETILSKLIHFFSVSKYAFSIAFFIKFLSKLAISPFLFFTNLIFIIQCIL